MLLLAIIVFALAPYAHCQNDFGLSVDKEYYHHDSFYSVNHLLFGKLTYLTFILVKIKIAFVIGLIIAFVVFGGKVFYLLKYLALSKHQHEKEKVYVQVPYDPHYPHDHRRTQFYQPYGRSLEETIEDDFRRILAMAPLGK